MHKNLLKCALIFSLFIASKSLDAQYHAVATSSTSIPLYTDEDIRVRLRNIASCVIPRYTDVVKGYIRTYTIKNRDKTERMLGKTVMYFPIYEKYAREYSLPEALKYLSITESALDPTAVSRASAVGLWQFMAPTGKEYGLRIDGTIDERMDPHRSTDAAMRYLQRQYKRFGNWPLAIAAYNSGGGNVSRAVRRGRSKNFWKIRKYLPRETRNYVPAYIAAAYLMQHYEKHNLNPQYPELDLQLTDAVTIYDNLDFNQISAMTGLSITTIRALNPSYKRDFIPASTKGQYLILPKRVLNAFNSHFRRPDSKRANNRFASSRNNKPSYTKSYYTVQQGDNLPFLAKLFNCDPYHLMVWNDLKTEHVTPGQELLLFSIANDRVVDINDDGAQSNGLVAKLPILQPTSVMPLNGTYIVQHKIIESPKEYRYHTIQRNETLKSIAAKYRISIPILLKLNNIDEGKLPKPGNRIKVKLMN